MRCVLVDDEPLARERFRALLEESDASVEIVGEAGSGREAVPLIHEAEPDVVFLDVQMPALDGFDVVDLLAPPRPHVVFVTAYDEYALRAFEVHALDYLTKPVRLGRLNDALHHVQQRVDAEASDAGLEALRSDRQSEPLRRLTVHVGRRLRVVDLDRVRWIESDDRLVFAHLDDARYRTDFTLDTLEQRLPAGRFVRTHRTCIVNLDAVFEMVPGTSGTYTLRLDDGHTVPVARRRAQRVKDALGG
jgi:two-component system LytT family response regulator